MAIFPPNLGLLAHVGPTRYGSRSCGVLLFVKLLKLFFVDFFDTFSEYFPENTKNSRKQELTLGTRLIC